MKKSAETEKKKSFTRYGINSAVRSQACSKVLKQASLDKLLFESGEEEQQQSQAPKARILGSEQPGSGAVIESLRLNYVLIIYLATSSANKRIIQI